MKSHFSRTPSFWLVETDVRIITNFVLLFGAFFCWWTQFMKLGVNQFSSSFSVPNNENNFSSQWKRIFYRMLHSGGWKRISCLMFFYSEQMLCQWKLLFKTRWSHFYRVTSLLLGTIFYEFFQVFLPVKAAFPCSGNVYFYLILHSGLWNQNFCLSETVFFYLQL